MVEVDQLVKHYGPTVALDGISFGVERGDIVGFLGPNGAGKTTTMRILTSYIPATAGTATVAGLDVFRDSLDVRRHIGYLPEGVPLYPEMRVREYLLFRARLKRLRARERKKRVDYVMERCGVSEVRRKLISGLSKGYRQRVGLAEALVHDPPVLILDEPTIGLDPNQVRQVRGLIRELGLDHTIILSTHILTEVEMVCNRVIIVNDGRLAFQDTLEAIAASRGHETLLVELDAPRETALNALRGIAGVLAVTAERSGKSHRFELRVKPGIDVRAEIYQRAVRNSWTLTELRSARASLEDIFARLTSRESA